MSQIQSVHVKSEIKQDKFSLLKSPMLRIGVLAFVILAIWAFGTVSAYGALNEPTGGNRLSLNPELSAARRYADDIAAAREAAATLSQNKAVGVDFDAAVLVAGELNASDISAARQAAQYLAAARQVSGELSVGDIAAAREAAATLSQNKAVGVDFDAAELVAGELNASDFSAARQAAQYLAANPELKVAQRYAESAKEVQEKSSVWVANPELSAANRFAETSAAGIEEANLYQNPELKVVASQAVIMYGDYDSDFLATNPEIKAHQRFVEGIGK